MKYNIEKVLQDSDINIVLDSLGIKVTKGKFKCLSHNDKRPSCKIYNKTNSCYCFACNWSGNVIDIVQAALNYSFPGAVEYVIESCGLYKDNYIEQKDNKQENNKKPVISLSDMQTLGISNKTAIFETGSKMGKYINPIGDLDEEALEYLIQTRKKEMLDKIEVAKAMMDNSNILKMMLNKDEILTELDYMKNKVNIAASNTTKVIKLIRKDTINKEIIELHDKMRNSIKATTLRGMLGYEENTKEWYQKQIKLLEKEIS